MCGIAGIIGPNATPEIVSRMLYAQRHRGPDAIGEYCDTDIALGHNRLSIIDLSENANQPFYSQDENYILVYNGEIYNYLELRDALKKYHTFQTSSDTEVLLAAYMHWGEDCVHHFNGMFSCAIWNRKTKELFVARDRFGVKPFYYAHHDDCFYFASEIKTLLAAGVPNIPNEKVWASYLAFGSYGMPTETFYQGIQQLEPGCHAIICQQQLDIKRWYRFKHEVSKQPVFETEDEIIHHYTALLFDSIRLRFRADVPVGVNCSGGLDSSALLTFIKLTQDSADCNAYSFYTGDARYDELPWVEKLVETAGCPIKPVLFDDEMARKNFKEVSAIQDEPFGGIPTMAYATLFKQAQKDGVFVLLDGQGMDEQWAGYDYYKNLTDKVKAPTAMIQGVKKSPLRPQVLVKSFLDKAEKPLYPEPFDNALQNIQFRDLFFTKIPRALRFNDRVSMASSTELREPFLDYRLVEFAFAQKAKFKIKDGVHKYIVRKIVDVYVDDTISLAPKRPLQTPQREWLANELRPLVENMVDILKSSYYGKWFDIPILEQELKRYFDGDQEASFHIWQWINLAQLLVLKKKTDD
ncbi:asparagine synthase (glutamine-hydrolyzing) [Ulvibacter sp.]|nr:asparagine synthase (glutamine-hydrolyzing) [Ulvibacter sp.]